MNDFTVKIDSRRESVEYREGLDVHRFTLAFTRRTWVVTVPGTRGEFYETHNLTEPERSRILPRIKQHLESQKAFGIFGRTYPAVFEPEVPLTPEMAERRARFTAFFQQEKARVALLVQHQDLLPVDKRVVARWLTEVWAKRSEPMPRELKQRAWRLFPYSLDHPGAVHWVLRVLAAELLLQHKETIAERQKQHQAD